MPAILFSDHVARGSCALGDHITRARARYHDVRRVSRSSLRSLHCNGFEDRPFWVDTELDSALLRGYDDDINSIERNDRNRRGN